MNMNQQGTIGADNYDGVAKALHWAVAGLIVLQFVLAKLAEESGSEAQELLLLANHRSVGLTIFALAILRLGWRFYRPPPKLLPMPGWQQIASQVAHWSLYALIFLLPITGWLYSSAEAVRIEWFNLFDVPDLMSANQELAEPIEEIHETLAKVLMAIALLHIAAGLKHGFIDKDATLRRISSKASIGLFVLIVILGAVFLF